MAYSEVIKNFNRIREYMREFYVYGFKSRDDYTKKSSRSYDDERRRLESWLGDYMSFRQTAEGKTVFLSIDSRLSHHNPLYKAWKTKSFTDGDITLHFILMDLFASAEDALTIGEIAECVDEYLAVFEEPKTFDESTIRKKLKEYAEEGIVLAEKKGKTVVYRIAQSPAFCNETVLDYFSEAAPLGVIGSYLLDKAELPKDHEELFAFKHHYITGALDSEILCKLFLAMREHRMITMETINRNMDRVTERSAVPLQIMISAQSGREYLMAYRSDLKRISSFRLDNIITVREEGVCDDFEALRESFRAMLPYIWGVSTQSRSGQRMDHAEFTIRYGEDEKHIRQRLEREKRCGTVEDLDEHTCRFRAEVYDASELIPWIRTFLCRITDFHISDPKLEKQFLDDIREMCRMYGLEGGEKE